MSLYIRLPFASLFIQREEQSSYWEVRRNSMNLGRWNLMWNREASGRRFLIEW